MNQTEVGTNHNERISKEEFMKAGYGCPVNPGAWWCPTRIEISDDFETDTRHTPFVKLLRILDDEKKQEKELQNK